MQNRDTVDACEAMLMRISQYNASLIPCTVIQCQRSQISQWSVGCLLVFAMRKNIETLSVKDCKIWAFVWRFWPFFFIVPLLIWHGASFFPVSSEGKPNSFLSYDKQGILRTYSYPYPNEFFSQRCNRSDLSWPYTIVYRTHNLPYTRRTTWFVNPWLWHVSKVLFTLQGP